MTTLTLLHKLSAIPALAAEVFTAAALLWSINFLANLIRLIVDSLKVGWELIKFIAALLLLCFDGLRYINDHIDWPQVRHRALTITLKVIAAVVAAIQVSWAWLSTNIPAAYYWYEQRFIDVPQSAPVASVSVITPLRDAKGRFTSPKRTVRRHGRLVAA